MLRGQGKGGLRGQEARAGLDETGTAQEAQEPEEKVIGFIADLAPTVLTLAAVALGVTGRIPPTTMYGLCALGCWGSYIADQFTETGLYTPISGALAMLYTWLWWRDGGGRGGKRAARELGAKSWALIRGLVERVSPSPAPSPAGTR